MVKIENELSLPEMMAKIQSYPLFRILENAESWEKDYISGSTPYNFDKDTANRIIDDLIKMVQILNQKGKHKSTIPIDAIYPMLTFIEEEGLEIYENGKKGLGSQGG